MDEAPSKTPSKPVESPKKPKKEENLFDMDFDDEPPKKEEKKPEGGDIFDLLGESGQETKPEKTQ